MTGGRFIQGLLTGVAKKWGHLTGVGAIDRGGAIDRTPFSTECPEFEVSPLDIGTEILASLIFLLDAVNAVK